MKLNLIKKKVTKEFKKPGKKGGLPPKKTDMEVLKNLLDVVSHGKKMWESTFDVIRDPVMIIDQHFMIRRANVATADRAQVNIRNLIGEKCYEIFAKRDSVCPSCPLYETVQSQAPQSVEINGAIQQGTFQVSSYPLPIEPRSSGKEERAVVHHYRDVTEEKRLQGQLMQSEKMAAIGMLAGGVAHEINNPLAGILAFSQLLKKDLAPTTQAYQDVKEIEEAAKRCKKIVEDLLVFARPHRAKDMTSVSLQETVETILPLVKLDFRHRQIS
ncbi:MAG: PAS domain-containing protein, partial [Deltaproteobacteria bacterium]|nr:PAS domain-containing protein [Deltaproteobacteria bacterium]